MAVTCSRVGFMHLFRSSLYVPVRYMAHDKKQRTGYMKKKVDRMMERLEKERKEGQALTHDECTEMDSMTELFDTFQHERYERSRMKKNILNKKFNRSAPEENVLTWHAKQQIIYLCTEEGWSTQEIAESFPINAGNVVKLLRHKNRVLAPSEINDHDKKVMIKWKKLLEAGKKLDKGPLDPKIKQIVESERIKLIHNAAGVANVPVPLSRQGEQVNNHLEFYTFHYADNGKQKSKLNSRYDGQFLKLYRIFSKPLVSSDLENSSVASVNDQTGVLEKEAEKLKLLQALTSSYENEKKTEVEECDVVSTRKYANFHNREGIEDNSDLDAFDNEWFAPKTTSG